MGHCGRRSAFLGDDARATGLGAQCRASGWQSMEWLLGSVRRISGGNHGSVSNDTLAACGPAGPVRGARPRRMAQGKQRAFSRSEEHTSELQSLMRISYAVFCLKKKNNTTSRAQVD